MEQIPLHPELECDLVLKGGATSGIVYPKGVFEIAKKYRLNNIGGTSSGAIAAAIAAAAEYRRQSGSAEGFNEMFSLPDKLGDKVNGKTKLVSLFEANKSTRLYYNFIMFASKQFSKGNFFNLAVILLLFALFSTGLYFVLKWVFFTGAGSAVVYLLSVYIALTIIIAALTVFIILLIKKVKKNNFGFTTGYVADGKNGAAKTDSMVPWLSGYLDEVAGAAGSAPLTFGMLYSKNIKLQMVVANLNFGVPHTFPFNEHDSVGSYYFKKEEMEKYFPPMIINKLVKDTLGMEKDKDGTKYYLLPHNDNIPVIFGVRLSLSFPVIFSAVPLYYKNRKRKTKTGAGNTEFQRCLFSDGGICSNFPVHLFDCPLPARPTFAINLRPFPAKKTESKNNHENVYMPETNDDGIEEQWISNDETILSFLFSVFTTAQNWGDNTQARMPGSRDRICHIYLSSKEDGFNFNMDKKFIDNLSERGACAGEKLRQRFSGEIPTSMNWENHKWVRFRTSIALMGDYLKNLFSRYDKKELNYESLLLRQPGTPPLDYDFDPEKKIKIKNNLDALDKIVTALPEDVFTDNIPPKPMPDLMAKPKI